MDHELLQKADAWVAGFSPPCPPRIIVFGVPLLIILFIIWIVVKKIYSPPSHNTILIMGPEGSGKTCLWHWLRFGTELGTVTSGKVNEETFQLHSEVKEGINRSPVHIVDCPGNPRLCNIPKDFFPVTTGIIYLIDSTNFRDQARVIGDQLYQILTSEKLIRNECEVFIACNKSDLEASKDWELIKKHLQKEMNNLCKSKAASPDTTAGGDKEEERLLVEEDEDFDFDNTTLKCYFVNTTLRSKQDKMVRFEGFIRSRVL